MTETQTILKASDLRIGNWVNHEGQSQKIIAIQDTWTSISDGVVAFDFGIDNPMWREVYDLQPIELTPEILEKAGFVASDEYAGYFIEIGRKAFVAGITPYPNDFAILYRSDIGMSFNELDIYEHLHSLQNLIFALTGSELEIDLSR